MIIAVHWAPAMTTRAHLSSFVPARPAVAGSVLALVVAVGAAAPASGVTGTVPPVTVVAGTGTAGYSGDGGPAGEATFSAIEDVAVDELGRTWVLDTYNNAVRRIERDGTVDTVVGPEAGLLFPFDLAVRDGRVVVADSYNQRVVEVADDGSLVVLAGTGTPGSGGDGGPATQAELRFPFGVDITPDGTVLVADTFNHRIRAIDRDGTIRTVLGDGTPGFSGDGGPASEARVDLPYDVAWSGGGSFAVADTRNHRVRVVARGTVTTVLGTGETGLADASTARASRVWSPSGVAARPDGTLVVADFRNDRVVQVRQDRLRVLAAGDDVAVRGGVAVSRDGRTVVWADTFAYRVSALRGLR
jgi:hypothetical protein